MNAAQLQTLARTLVSEGKGLLAADESPGTLEKRLRAAGVEASPEIRRRYREMLLTTAELERFISGVILHDETIRQTTGAGLPFPQLLLDRGMMPGVKVDKGTIPLPLHPGERITEGLDGLRQRLGEYRELGARFTKWRAVFEIGDGIPTRYGVIASAEVLARYAAASQEADLVPIVEPEVLHEGRHSLARCAEVSEVVLRQTFAALREAGVLLEGMLLKPSMVLPGRDASERAAPDDIASATLRVLRRTVPAAVPGIVFLSGGQSPEQATVHLSRMNQARPQPWELGFSFARALQDPALALWAGREENVPAAQRLFRHRARCASAARYGQYTDALEANGV